MKLALPAEREPLGVGPAKCVFKSPPGNSDARGAGDDAMPNLPSFSQSVDVTVG